MITRSYSELIRLRSLSTVDEDDNFKTLKSDAQYFYLHKSILELAVLSNPGSKS